MILNKLGENVSNVALPSRAVIILKRLKRNKSTRLDNSFNNPSVLMPVAHFSFTREKRKALQKEINSRCLTRILTRMSFILIDTNFARQMDVLKPTLLTFFVISSYTIHP